MQALQHCFMARHQSLGKNSLAGYERYQGYQHGSACWKTPHWILWCKLPNRIQVPEPLHWSHTPPNLLPREPKHPSASGGIRSGVLPRHGCAAVASAVVSLVVWHLELPRPAGAGLPQSLVGLLVAGAVQINEMKWIKRLLSNLQPEGQPKKGRQRQSWKS